MPVLYYFLLRTKPRLRKLAVNKETQLVIEGFPRSGNTFAVVAFESAQISHIKIAHHLHAPAQIIRSAMYGIPLLVLIREPVDAIASYMIRDESVTIADAFCDYIKFYEYVCKYRDQIFLARFEDVISDFGIVLEGVNAKYLTKFTLFEHTPENEDKVFSKIDDYSKKLNAGELGVARPSLSRAHLKERLLGEIMSLEYTKLRDKADALYRMLVS